MSQVTPMACVLQTEVGRRIRQASACLAAAVFIAPALPASEPVRFSEHLLAQKLGYVFGVAAADLDGDGDFDLTSPDIRDKSHSTLFWYQNNGRGEFARRSIYEDEPGWFERHVIGDIDADGHPDVAIVNNQKGQVVWFANPGTPSSGNWKRYEISTDCPRAYDVTLVDVDGDGDLDAATAGYLSHLIAWYENPGKASLHKAWPRQIIDDSLREARTIEAADLNGDGRFDLLATAVGSLPADSPDSPHHQSQVVWYENTGLAGSARWAKQLIEGQLPAAIHGQPIDLDRDGDQDVVMAHGMRIEADPRVERHQVVWYENKSAAAGFPTWTRHQVGNLPFAFEAVAGDIDGDGDLDIAASAWSKGDRIVWFQNQGRGEWTSHLVKADWPAANQLILVDLNGDRRLDIVASADDGSRRVAGALEVRWWRNDGGR